MDVTQQHEAMELQGTLLHEVSHRVKNSLALVSSLLNLQARPLEGDARRALEEASARVHAVAQVHDQLWRGASTREIDLGQFLCRLSAAVASTAPRLSTVCRADPAVVSADLAVPLGLLINELLTNAYKYAYPGETGGEVQVTGTDVAERGYRLEVSDAGRGLPAGFDLHKARDSLGMRVITSLAAQLRGELTASSADPGARFTLVFPLKVAA
jgi:two-component sensor histidine kinase